MKILFPLFLSACLYASADTIKLIDGTTYENCKILFQQGEDLVIEHPDPKTPSIRRETRIKEYDILKHIKSTPADLEFKRIIRKEARLDEMTPQEREETLQAITRFLDQNPSYPQTARLEELADSLRKTAQTGNKSPGGTEKTPPAETPAAPSLDKERYAYDHEANRLYNDMMEHARNGRLVEAMQMYTLLEKFQGSDAYVKAYPEAARIAGELQTQWTRQLEGLRKIQRERKRQMDAMPPQKQEIAEKYLAKQRNEQQAASDHLINEAKKQKWNWFSPPDNNLPATESALNLAQTSSERLSRPIGQTGLRPGSLTPLVIGFWQHIDAGNLPQAHETLKQIRAVNMPANYLEPLERALRKQQQTSSSPEEQH